MTVFRCDKQALDDTLEMETEQLNGVLDQLKRLPLDLDATLAQTIKSGVAFHHAGMNILGFKESD